MKALLIISLIQITLVFCHRVKNTEVANVSHQNVDSQEQVFDIINNLIMDHVPEHSSFVHANSKIPLPDGHYWTPEYLGWIIDEDSIFYTFLDCSAQKIKIEKRYSSVSPASLKEESKKAINYEGLFGDRWRPVRRHAGSEIVPLYVMALWCYNNNLKDEAMAIVNEGSTGNTKSKKMLNFLFGNLYYNEMLYAYSQERDYKKAILLSEHLAKPEFMDFQHRSDAIQLGEQIKKRSDDFVTLKLPSKYEWDSLKTTLSRAKQIKYLCKRLKLLNCIQIHQPGGISYGDIQYSVPSITFARSVQMLANWPLYAEGVESKQYEVINPFNELRDMKLKPVDIKLIAPYLADQDYIVAYSFHRDFKSERYLHKVNELLSDIILSSVGKSFVDMKRFNSLDNRSKRKEIRKIIKWCNKNDGLTEETLALKTLKCTDNWPEFETAMNKCLEKKYTEAVPVLIKRINDFDVSFQPLIKDRIAETIFNFGPDEIITIGKLRELEANNDYWVKRWASLYIIKYKDLNFAEGLSTLKQVLDSCNGTTWYPSSIKILLESKQEEAHKLADGILDKPGFQQDFERAFYNEQIKNLFLSGREKAYNFLLKGLNDLRIDSTRSMGSNELLFCDRYMTLVNDWKGIDDDDHYLKSLKEHKVISKEMTNWLDEQFRLVKSGKYSGIKQNKVNEPVFSLDAPGY